MTQTDQPAQPACIIQECDRTAKTSGLCSSCYETARLLINQGKRTREWLEEHNLILPRSSRRAIDNPLRIAHDAIEAELEEEGIAMGKSPQRPQRTAEVAGKGHPVRHDA